MVENLGEAIGPVIFGARIIEGEDQAARHDHHCEPARHDERHRSGLTLETAQVAEQLAIEVGKHGG